MIEFIDLPGWFKGSHQELRAWLNEVASTHDSQINQLSYTFLSSGDIQTANVQYLNHDYPTDIITFGYEEGSVVSGEILIGEEVVRENAGNFNVTNQQEMCRVIAHGLLHLIGFNDSSEAERERMRAEEDKSLILRPKNLRDK